MAEGGIAVDIGKKQPEAQQTPQISPQTLPPANGASVDASAAGGSSSTDSAASAGAAQKSEPSNGVGKPDGAPEQKPPLPPDAQHGPTPACSCSSLGQPTVMQGPGVAKINKQFQFIASTSSPDNHGFVRLAAVTNKVRSVCSFNHHVYVRVCNCVCCAVCL